MPRLASTSRCGAWARSGRRAFPRLSFTRADVAPDVEAGYRLAAEAFQELAGRDPARAAQAGSWMSQALGILLGRLAEARSYSAAAVTQARAAGDPVVLREVLAMDGWLAAVAGEADAGARLRAAVGLPGLPETPAPY